MHAFDAAVALKPGAEPGVLEGSTHAAWQNMVGPFGGITAATLLQALLLHPERLGEPVAVTVNYCAAVADGAFQISAKPLRTNRSTQHWLITLTQQGEIATTATAVTAIRRETYSAQEWPMPNVPSASEVPSAADHRLRPEWTRRYDMRPITGGIPAAWDGSVGSSLSQLWLRDEPPRALDHAALLAISDSFFGRIILRRKRLVPFGTVSLTTNFHCTQSELAAVPLGQHLLCQAQGQQFRNGFHDQTAALWSAGGDLLATSQQIVYYKE